VNTFPEGSEQQLLRGLKSGEKAAYEQLVRQFRGPLRRVAAAIVGEADAEECVQEALIAAIRQIDRFEGRSSLKTWLFTIAANQARSRLRKQKRQLSLEEMTEGSGLSDAMFRPDGHWAQAPAAWHDDSPEALLSHQEFLNCLDKTIHHLPEQQKAVMTLREYQGMEIEEICNILELRASNVRVLIHRARTTVYAMISHYEETGTC
jgi:RNA polymerase sigma-70 factor (ECF subfamily)